MSDKPISLVVLAIARNSKNEILMIKRGKNPKVGYYSLPGGHVEFGEKVTETVVREMKEETGLDVRPVNYVTFYESIHEEYHEFIIVYMIKILGNEIAKAAEDATEAIWIGVDDIPSLGKVTNITFHALQKAGLIN